MSCALALMSCAPALLGIFSYCIFFLGVLHEEPFGD